jgi:hypothetical protein
MAKYKVIQFATGMTGKAAIRAMADHPELELVGCLVFAKDKVGKDAGEIAGIGRIGVTATDNFEDILKIEADAVSFNGMWPDLDKVCPLLASGKHVAMSAGLIYPKYLGPAVVNRLETACKQGHTSVFGGGISPGFVQCLAPIALSSMARRIDSIYMQEFVDMRGYDSYDLIVNMLGMGRTLEDVTKNKHPSFDTMMPDFFLQAVALTADALKLPVERFDKRYEYAITPGGSEASFGKIAPGTIGGLRATFVAVHDGKEKLVAELNWQCAFDLGAGWMQRSDLDNAQQWRITLEGDPSLRLISEQASTFKRKMGREEQSTDHAIVATTMSVLNAIPYLCEAQEPGIKTLLNLPLIAARYGAR